MMKKFQAFVVSSLFLFGTNAQAAASSSLGCEAEAHLNGKSAICLEAHRKNATSLAQSQITEQLLISERERTQALSKESRSHSQLRAPASQRQHRIEAAVHKRCEKLDARAKWAAGKAEHAKPKNLEKSHRRAHQAVEQFVNECDFSGDAHPHLSVISR